MNCAFAPIIVGGVLAALGLVAILWLEFTEPIKGWSDDENELEEPSRQ